MTMGVTLFWDIMFREVLPKHRIKLEVRGAIMNDMAYDPLVKVLPKHIKNWKPIFKEAMCRYFRLQFTDGEERCEKFLKGFEKEKVLGKTE